MDNFLATIPPCLLVMRKSLVQGKMCDTPYCIRSPYHSLLFVLRLPDRRHQHGADGIMDKTSRHQILHQLVLLSSSA